MDAATTRILYCCVRGYKPSKEQERRLTTEDQRGLYIILSSAKNRDSKAIMLSLLIESLPVAADVAVDDNGHSGGVHGGCSLFLAELASAS
jgi:hypothetical protein